MNKARERRKARVSKDIYDRFTALQNKSEYMMEGNVTENAVGNGIKVYADLITSPAINQILAEFENVLINKDGLMIFD